MLAFQKMFRRACFLFELFLLFRKFSISSRRLCTLKVYGHMFANTDRRAAEITAATFAKTKL
jgi:hypothetical protein